MQSCVSLEPVFFFVKFLGLGNDFFDFLFDELFSSSEVCSVHSLIFRSIGPNLGSIDHYFAHARQSYLKRGLENFFEYLFEIREFVLAEVCNGAKIRSESSGEPHKNNVFFQAISEFSRASDSGGVAV